MAQHDYDIANQSGAAFRTDLNNALDAIVTTNSGSTEPATTFAFQFWADTDANQLKMRNAANDDWIVILETDGDIPAKTFTGNITMNAQTDVRFGDSDSTNFISFQAPATVGSDVTFTLPDSDGSADHVLKTDGSGNLSFAAAAGGDISDTAPERIFTNTTEEDTDGGRESKITFKGEQSGGEVSTLAQIEVSHDGTSDDEKGQIIFKTNDGNDGSSPTSRMTIDSAGDVDIASNTLFVDASTSRVGIGTNSPTYLTDIQADGGGGTERVRIFNTGSATNDDVLLALETGATDNECLIWFGDSDDNNVGQIRYDHGTNSIEFYANAAERVRIDGDGLVLVGKTTSNTADVGIALSPSGLGRFTRDGGSCAFFNRNTDDGTIVQFLQANTTEGTVTVSGTTVSYNGGHLARWSQLPSGVERTEILRGSVLSNLDEMCEWAYDAEPEVLWAEGDELPEGVSVGDVKTPARDAGTEENEQLNRMKVSDVEGDVNVAGVFQCWDDDDDTYTNDFYCAMTGDFVIRIAQGTTVARGDLLMSAGDGTAKPQDDDIVRSKTVAKVTSTTVSETYADGSYCVPCVLMAC